MSGELVDRIQEPGKARLKHPSGELLDRVQELLLQVAALEADIKILEAELSECRARAEIYTRMAHGNLDKKDE